MISIVWSMNVDKSNTLYCDVICKVIKCYYSNIKHRQNVCFALRWGGEVILYY